MSAEVALSVESLLVRTSVRGSPHKLYLGKWNAWVEFMKKKGKGPWLNLLDKSEVLTLLLEFMTCLLFHLITSSPLSEGTSPRSSFFTSCT